MRFLKAWGKMYYCEWVIAHDVINTELFRGSVFKVNDVRQLPACTKVIVLYISRTLMTVTDMYEDYQPWTSIQIVLMDPLFRCILGLLLKSRYLIFFKDKLFTHRRTCLFCHIIKNNKKSNLKKSYVLNLSRFLDAFIWFSSEFHLGLREKKLDFKKFLQMKKK